MIDERKPQIRAKRRRSYVEREVAGLQPSRADKRAGGYPNKTLIFFGNERLATGVTSQLAVLKALERAGYEIVAVVSSQQPGGNSRIVRALEIAEYAKQKQIPYLSSLNPQQIRALVKKSKVEVAILVAFGQIVPASVIDLFAKGIINIHPSLLPRYRGPTPIETAILDGARKTGVSLMQLAPKLDAGPVYIQQSLKLSNKDTKQGLADKLGQLGADLLIKELPRILNGYLQPKPQRGRASYSRLLTKTDGRLTFRHSATRVERQVRAYAGFPKAAANLGGYSVIITKARIVRNFGNDQLVVKCSPGFLEIVELIGPSGRTMSGADFKRGYRV